jgi:hypothetical protein
VAVRDYSIRSSAKENIAAMLDIAPQFFPDAFWQLQNIASTLVSIERREFYAGPIERKKLIDSLAKKFDERFRKRLKEKTIRRHHCIIPFNVSTAILELHRQSGERPSQNKVAKKLGVTAKALRDWSKDQGYNSFEHYLDVWLSGLGGEKLKLYKSLE